MADIVTDYDVVCACDLCNLREKMAIKMNDGWIPDGNVLKEKNQEGVEKWHQKIIKIKKGPA